MTQPTILAFDTSAPHCAATLLHKGQVITRIDEMAKGQAEHLMPMLEEILAAEGLAWANLDAIGVGIGPGNFTGIRIAVAAARGLALGLAKPAVGVSTLDAQTYGLGAGTIVSCADARRDMAYVQLGMQVDTAQLVQLTADAMPALNLKSDPRVVGGVADQIAALTGWQPVTANVPTIEGIAHLAAARHANVNLPRPAPLYLRSADAAPPRDAPPKIIT